MDKTHKSGFTQEFSAVWGRLEYKAVFFGLLAVWLLLFHFLGNSTFGYVDTHSLPEWMWTVYTVKDSDDSHGLLIPFVVLFLFWWKRDRLLAIPQQNWWPGLMLLAAAIVLHVFGYAVQQPRISIVAFFTGIYALIGLTWGWQWMKQSFFPFVLFAFSVPISSLEVMKTITLPLRVFATTVSAAIANGLFGFGVVRQGTLLFDATGRYTYDIAAACSGIRSLISLFVLMLIYAVVTFKNPKRRLAVVLASIPFAIACNVLRLLSVILAAELFGQKAGDVVHEWSGFFTYVLAVVSMAVMSRIWQEPEPSPVLLTPKTV